MKLRTNTEVCAMHSCNNKRATKEGGEKQSLEEWKGGIEMQGVSLTSGRGL